MDSYQRSDLKEKYDLSFEEVNILFPVNSFDYHKVESTINLVESVRRKEFNPTELKAVAMKIIRT